MEANLNPQSKIVLTVVKGPEKGKTFEFTEQDNFLLGRDAQGSNAHFRLSHGRRDTPFIKIV
jgi:hypothetical protein